MTSQDVQLQEGNVQFMSDEYQQILRDSEKLKAEYNRQPWHLERLHGKSSIHLVQAIISYLTYLTHFGTYFFIILISVRI